VAGSHVIVRHPGSGNALRLGATGLATVATLWLIAIAVDTIAATRFNTDSFRYLISAATLEETGDLTGIGYRDMSKRLLGTPMLHTFGTVSGRGYVAVITPMLALSGAATMVWLSSEAFTSVRTPRKWRLLLLVTGVAALISTNRFVFASFYVNGHMLFAVMALIGVGAAWLGTVRRMPALLLPAGLAFAALVPIRAESTIVAAVLLLPFVARGRLGTHALSLLVTPFVAAVIMWHGFAFPRLVSEADPGWFGPSRGPLFIGIFVCTACLGRRTRIGGFMADNASRIALLGLLGYTTVSAVRRPDILIDSITATIDNMFRLGLWSLFWWMLTPVLLTVVVAKVRFRYSEVWSSGLLGFAVALMALPYLRGVAYRGGWEDSGNRMLLHIVLVVVAYLIVMGAAAIRSAEREEGLVIDLTQLEHMEAAAPVTSSEPDVAQLVGQPSRR
ncbi:MAG: hypothetical protein OEM97_11775, partial [Acidimicrobiia bacterium]|nr:hypothetical protein [Acidimicrobiia bacterium]